MSDRRDGPVLIDLEADDRAVDPSQAPVIGAPPTPASMQQAAVWMARPASPLARIFWGALGGLVVVIATTALWDFVLGLFSRSVVLGALAGAFAVAAAVTAVIFVAWELAAWWRLRRLDDLHAAGVAAASAHNLQEARGVVDDLAAFYDGRADMDAGLRRLAARRDDVFDADAVLGLAETSLLEPLDRLAEQEVEGAARQVATVTALVPLALADIVAALTANLRMIRRIAEIYGGRAGTLGSWRLTRTVLTHLVATGAVAIGDDMIESVVGGGLVGRLSRRFGEGVVNGALTARVGVAAMEVCRPLPFVARPRPLVSGLVKRALTGLFGRSGSGAEPG